MSQLENTLHLAHSEVTPQLEIDSNWKTVVVRIFIIVISDDGVEVLLARRPTWSKLAPSKFTPLGGKVKPDKDIGDTQATQVESAIRREVAEELRIHGTPPTLWELEKDGEFQNHQANILTAFFHTIFDLRQTQTRKSDFELAFKTKGKTDDGRFKQDNYDLTFLSLDSVPMEGFAFEYGVEYLRFIKQNYPDQLTPLITQNLERVLVEYENLLLRRITADLVESTDAQEATIAALCSRYDSRCKKSIRVLLGQNRALNVQALDVVRRSFEYNSQKLLQTVRDLKILDPEIATVIQKISKLLEILDIFLQT